MSTTRIETSGYKDYREYSQKNDFSHDLGLAVLPVAGRTAAHRVIRLHGGMATRTVKWRAQRDGRPPLIPAAIDSRADTLLHTVVRPSLPVMNGGGGFDWAVEGEYTFVQNSPREAGTHTFPVGEYPFTVHPSFAAGTALISGPAGEYYTGTDPFNTLMEYVAAKLERSPNPDWTWPLLALPSIFSSDHLIGG